MAFEDRSLACECAGCSGKKANGEPSRGLAGTPVVTVLPPVFENIGEAVVQATDPGYRKL